MAKPRKKHVQQTFEFRTHGGKRPGAGRPPKKGRRPSEPHTERPEIDCRHPLHIVSRVVEGLGSLRRREMFLAVRAATIVAFEAPGFHIVYLSIQRNHLHLIVEAKDKDKLAEGMKVFLGSAAKRINGVISRQHRARRRGQVFADRYFATPLTTPRAVRHTIGYVLNNWRKHREDRAPIAAGWKVDPFSNGADFWWWKERVDVPFLYRTPPTYLGLVTWLPRTWLLRVGWLRHGLVSVTELPGPRN